MIRWKSWLLSALFVTAILTGLAAWLTAPIVENELASATNAKLGTTGNDWAKVTMDGRDLTLSGTAPDNDAVKSAIELAANIYDVRIVENKTQLIPLATPYKFSSKQQNGSLLLSGFAPNTQTITKLLAQAQTTLPDIAIINELKPARGQPDNFFSAVTFGIRQFEKLSEGEFSLNDNKYAITGTAKTSSDYETANNEQKAGLPANFTLDTANIRPPSVSPYQWRAQLDGNRITLSCTVPDFQTRNNILATASSENPGKVINDNLTYASGAPEGFNNATVFGLSTFRQLSTANYELNNYDLKLSGQAVTIDSFEKVANRIGNEIPAGYTMVEAKISRAIAKPYKWGAKLDANALTLSGFAPDSRTMNLLVDSARQLAPQRNIDNQLRIASGEPQGFDKAALYALSLLQKLKSGEVNLDENRIDITGIAKSVDAFDNITTQLEENNPAGFEITSRQIERAGISPYIWAATKDQGRLVLEGYAPDQRISTLIGKQLLEANPGVKLINKLKIATGAPVDFQASTRFTQQVFSKLTKGKATYRDGELSISGKAASTQDYATLVNMNVPDDVNLVTKSIKPARINPYKLRVAVNNDEIIMSGYLPDEESRARLKAALLDLKPAANIIGQTWIASGVPTGVNWENSARFGIDQLKHLSHGSFELDMNKFSIKGTAGSVEDYHNVKTALNNDLTKGLLLAKSEIKLPVASPYIWSAARQKNTVTLSGVVPSPALAAQNIDTVKSNLGQNAGMNNNQKLASGAPEGFSDVTRLALNMIGRLENSQASLKDKNLEISGEALNEQAAIAIRKQISSGLPRGFTGTTNISVRKVKPAQIVKADVCQALLNALQNDNTIHFAFSKYTIQEESFGLLDRLVFTAKRCPDSRISIEGHTDYFGPYTYNQILSENRASAVADYLTSHGIKDNRIESIGYGERKPLVLDGTPEGNAKNRRIEFRILN